MTNCICDEARSGWSDGGYPCPVHNKAAGVTVRPQSPSVSANRTTVRYRSSHQLTEAEPAAKPGQKKIEELIYPLEYLEADLINEDTRNLWIANSLIRVKQKMNEIIKWINSHE